MKTEVYSWRLSAQRKAELEAEARREGTSLSGLLEQVTADWLAERRNGHSDDEAEQAAIRKRARAAIGSVAATILRAPKEPANWFAKPFIKSILRNEILAASASGLPAALIDSGFVLAMIDRNDGWHNRCVEAYNNSRLPLLTSEAVLTEVFHLAARDVLDARGVWRLLRSGAIRMSPITNAELPQIQVLMDEYADRPMDFADATLVHLAARERLSVILTIDHDDFETYRLPGRNLRSCRPAADASVRILPGMRGEQRPSSTVDLESDMPSVQEALQRLEREIASARQQKYCS